MVSLNKPHEPVSRVGFDRSRSAIGRWSGNAWQWWPQNIERVSEDHDLCKSTRRGRDIAACICENRLGRRTAVERHRSGERQERTAAQAIEPQDQGPGADPDGFEAKDRIGEHHNEIDDHNDPAEQ